MRTRIVKKINKETTSGPSASKYKHHAMGGLSSAGVGGVVNPFARVVNYHAIDHAVNMGDHAIVGVVVNYHAI